MKKFKLTDTWQLVYDSITNKSYQVFQIQYLIDMPESNIKAGYLGGFVEHEENLSQDGLCLILDKAVVVGLSRVKENAVVEGKALVTGSVIVTDYASVSEQAHISEHVRICEYASVKGCSNVSGYTQIGGCVDVFGKSKIKHSSPILIGNHIEGNCIIYGDENGNGISISQNAQVRGNADICHNVILRDNCQVLDNTVLTDDVFISGESIISEYAQLSGNVQVRGSSQVKGRVKIKGHVEIEGNSIIGEDVMMQNMVSIRSSQIFGTITLEGAVQIAESKIEGQNIKISDFCNIFGSEFKLCKEIIMTNAVQMVSVLIVNASDIFLKDKTMLLGLKNDAIVISGKNMVFEGQSKVKSNPYCLNTLTKPSMSIKGNNIYIKDYAKLIGACLIESDVIIEDYASLINHSINIRKYSRTTFSGDMELIEESA